MSFIKESMKEFDHIVWPTPAETQKYFVTVVSMITLLTIFLFIIGTAFSVGLFEAKKQVAPASIQNTSSSQAPVGDLKLDDITTTPVDTSTPATPAK